MAGDEVERDAADRWYRHWGGRVAVVAEGVDVAEDAEPDHDFVSLGAGGGGGEEGVVGNVGAERGAGIAVVRAWLIFHSRNVYFRW